MRLARLHRRATRIPAPVLTRCDFVRDVVAADPGQSRRSTTKRTSRRPLGGSASATGGGITLNRGCGGRLTQWRARGSSARSPSTSIGIRSITRRTSAPTIQSRGKRGWRGPSSISRYDCAARRTRRARVASLTARLLAPWMTDAVTAGVAPARDGALMLRGWREAQPQVEELVSHGAVVGCVGRGCRAAVGVRP